MAGGAEGLRLKRETARSRRALLRLGLAGTAAVAAAVPATLVPAASAGAAPAVREPLIDKWLRTKKVQAGAQLTQRPTGFLDEATGRASGFDPMMFTKMIHALSPDIEIEWTDLPVSELILAWLAGKFDMLGQSLAATPARALQAWFTAVPTNYASGVAIVRKGGGINSNADLHKPGLRIAVLAGGSEAMNARALFPQARVSEFQSAINAGSEVAVGRADATILSAHNVAPILIPNANLTVLKGEALYLHASSWMLPMGDTKTLEWMNNYLRFASVGGEILAEWKKWYVPVLKPYGVVAAAVGPLGAPVYIDTGTA